MKHPALMFAAALVAVMVVSFAAFPARTVPQTSLAWETAQPPTLQSSSVHAMVGASFHAVSARF